MTVWYRERERERERIHWSTQPALAYEDASWLESSAKLRMAARQWQTAFWSLCTKHCMVPSEDGSMLMYGPSNKVGKTYR